MSYIRIDPNGPDTLVVTLDKNKVTFSRIAGTWKIGTPASGLTTADASSLQSFVSRVTSENGW